MSDWSKDINLEAIKEYLQECAENDDYHYEQYQVDIVMHEYIRQKQVIEAITSENVRLNNIINELENRDDVLEEFEDWLENQKTRNSEWDNFIMVDGRLGIPISYLLNKLQELKGEK